MLPGECLDTNRRIGCGQRTTQSRPRKCFELRCVANHFPLISPTAKIITWRRAFGSQSRWELTTTVHAVQGRPGMELQRLWGFCCCFWGSLVLAAIILQTAPPKPKSAATGVWLSRLAPSGLGPVHVTVHLPSTTTPRHLTVSSSLILFGGQYYTA